MSEEEKATLEFIKINNKHRYCDKNDVDFLLNLIEKQQKELDNIKEIEKSHKEENGKLRVEYEKVYEDNLTLAHELEQEKEKNKEIAIKNRALKEESNACGEQIVSLDNQLKAKEQEIEYLKSQIPSDKIFYYSDKDYIRKDKIKEKVEETNSEKLNYSEDEYYLENEVKGYAIDKLKELLEEK